VTKEEKVTLDAATVVTANIKCSNGLIHVIDAVLMPKFPEAAAPAEAA